MAAKKKSAAKNTTKKTPAKKSAAKKGAAKKAPAKKAPAKKSAAKKGATKKSAGKGAAKKGAKKGLASKTFADAGAKVDKMLARGQKGIRGLQSKVVDFEEKSRAFLVDASSSPAIKKIRNLAKKATQPRTGNGSARRKAGKSKSKGKAAKVVSNELSKLGDTLKDVFTPHHASASDAN